MGVDNEYSLGVRKICEQYETELNSGVFSDEYIQKMQTEIQTKVEPLMLADKPRIMVYGIYNSGKSTLVNAICRKAVAEVADRPMTYCVAEYDQGKYILIDSPGVNAPVEHEEIADGYINKCHIILFVISSKGIFEDKVNYQKMWELIKKGIPFLIVLNDRGAELPPRERKEEREQAIRQHEAELNDIKRKIIKNLVSVSGKTDVGEKYDVIVLNAGRAWKGIEKSNAALFEKSNVPSLMARIDQILEGKGALKQLLTPLSILAGLICDAEKTLIVQTGNENLASKREIFQQKTNLFKEAVLSSIRSSVEKHFNVFYNAYLGKDINVEQVWEEICDDVERNYKGLILPLLSYMKEAFPEIANKVDDRCNIERVNENYQAQSVSTDQRIKVSPAQNGDISIHIEREISAPGQKKKSSLIDSLFGNFRDIFKSKAQKEQEEFERLQAEVESYNRDVEQRLEEDIRRRQDARTAANKMVNDMSCELRTQIADDMQRKFDDILQYLDDKIKRSSETRSNIDSSLSRLKELEKAIFELRKEIGLY